MEKILQNKKCIDCKPLPDEKSVEIYIFLSFSVPEKVWLDLSHELDNKKGVIVIRGLPGNSFNALSEKIYNLKDKGLMADIQIYPQLFEKYQIKQVPAFVIINGNEFNKILGNISLQAALDITGSSNK